MARARTTKSIASRIELTYYQRPHPLRTWRARLSLAAFVLPLVVLGGLALGGDDRAVSPGGLSSAHSSFAAKCDECHTPWTAGSNRDALADAKCERCHRGAIHHASQSSTPHCASCHAEHLGQLHLSKVGDAHCTQCHGDLPRASSSSTTFVASIPDFARHPEFAVLRDHRPDPGTVALNHRKHLTLVMPTLKRTMVCADCHELEPGVGANRAMAPIRFDRHCASCHKLEMPAPFEGRRVEHGLAPELLPEPQRALATSLCSKCHQLGAPAAAMVARVAPSAIPSRWLDHARFDHDTHRMVECARCHAGAQRSEKTADVDLPSIATCRECHHADGGARSDCALCHGYHSHPNTPR
jgi:hypothetical protein